MAVIKVKPWGKDQGDYVLIEEEDFQAEIHTKYKEPKAAEAQAPAKPAEAAAKS